MDILTMLYQVGECYIPENYNLGEGTDRKSFFAVMKHHLSTKATLYATYTLCKTLASSVYPDDAVMVDNLFEVYLASVFQEKSIPSQRQALKALMLCEAQSNTAHAQMLKVAYNSETSEDIICALDVLEGDPNKDHFKVLVHALRRASNHSPVMTVFSDRATEQYLLQDVATPAVGRTSGSRLLLFLHHAATQKTVLGLGVLI